MGLKHYSFEEIIPYELLVLAVPSQLVLPESIWSGSGFVLGVLLLLVLVVITPSIPILLALLLLVLWKLLLLVLQNYSYYNLSIIIKCLAVILLS